EARRRSAECVVLEVAVDNIAALALYAARGFIPAGRRGNYYRRVGHSADALGLRLSLAGTPSPSLVFRASFFPLALLTAAVDCSCRRAHDWKNSGIDRIASSRIVNYI